MAEYCLVKGVLTNVGSGQAITVMQETGDVPDWLQGSITRSEEFDKGIMAIVEDPTLIIEGIAQSGSDAYEEKGIAYCTGFVGMEIAQILIPFAKAGKITTTAELNERINIRGIDEKAIKGSSNAEIKYKYNMIENPGPLVDIEGHPIANFYSGKYNAKVLTEDTIYNRGG